MRQATSNNRTRVILLFLMLAAVFGLHTWNAGKSEAAVTCNWHSAFSPPQLEITTGTATDNVTISRTTLAPTDRIVVNGNTGFCGDLDGSGAFASVNNVNRIEIKGNVGAQNFTIDATNGTFTPGAGGNGIVFDLDADANPPAGNDTLTLVGSPAPDSIKYQTGPAPTNPAVDPISPSSTFWAPPSSGTEYCNGSTTASVRLASPSFFPMVRYCNVEAHSAAGGAGDDTIDAHFLSTTVTLDGGDGTDTLVPPTNASGSGNSIVGGTGSDTVDYSNFGGQVGSLTLPNGGASFTTYGVKVDLPGGTARGVASEDRTKTLDQASAYTADASVVRDSLSGVENVKGSPFDDFMIGDGNNNNFVAGTASSSGFGDTVFYSAASSPVTVNLPSTSGSGATAGTDVLTGFENAVGSSNDDTLIGDSATNELDGADGNDSLNGGAGDDKLVGGNQSDTVDYSALTNSVTVDLNVGVPPTGTCATQVGTCQWERGAGGNDTLVFIENVNGSQAGDTITGDTNANTINGNAGNDTIVTGDGGDTVSGGSGNDTITGGAGVDTLHGDDGDDSIIGVAGGDHIDGGTNTPVGDTVDYAAQAGPVTVDLFAHTATGAADITAIENVVGSTGNDTITGDDNANSLSGGPGDDSLEGRGGDDRIDGGGQAGLGDTVTYQSATSSVTVNLTSGSASGTSTGADSLIGIENVTGSGSADTITGDSGNNVLKGAGGDDNLNGAAGDDTLDGGTQSVLGDTVDYSALSSSVTVNLNVVAPPTGACAPPNGPNCQFERGAGGNDTLVGIENVNGSQAGDTLTGDNNANTINGNAGNDTIVTGDGGDTVSGGSGNDTITGGAGVDTLHGDDGDDSIIGVAGGDHIDGGTNTPVGDSVDYSLQAGPVTVDLFAHTATGAADITAIENVVGSTGNDTITGGDNANSLSGGPGDDTLEGRGGDDRIDGGGQAGLGDTVTFQSATSSVTVNLTSGSASGNSTGTDVLIGVENVTGSPSDDNITGDGGINRLDGGAGNDIVSGLAGNDALLGGSENDILIGGLGDDSLDGVSGADTADYSGVSSPVTVNLATGLASGDGNDTLANIDNVNGSSAADLLTGNANANVINGNGGNDTIVGNGGTDALNGGSGNDLITGGTGTDTIHGDDGDDTIVAGAGTNTIDGGTGTDTIDYSGAPAITVNLSTNSGSGAGFSDTVTGVENVIGSPNTDTITGDGNANFLFGKDGADTLDGGGGNDTLYGGDASSDSSTGDRVSYASASSSVNVNLASGLANGNSTGLDTLIGIEDVTGSAFDDTITGNSGVNQINGGTGNDTLVGGGGNDFLTGGGGRDTADYSASAFPVNVNLSGDPACAGLPCAQGGTDVGTDILAAIANVTGTNQPDTITGDGGANTLTGLAGDDRLLGGGGNDTLDGGFGTDTADYSGAPGPSGVTVDLVAGTGTGDVTIGTDTLIAIENVTGTPFDDTISGNNLNNVLDGGVGNDTVGFANRPSGVTVSLLNGTATGQGTDTLIGFENVTGSPSTDTITGDDFSNVLNGGAGNDTLIGLGGNDSLFGGSGIDTVSYAAAPSGVTVDLSGASCFLSIPCGTDSPANIVGTDILSGIENVTGSNQADTLLGDGLDNTLLGLAGDDTLAGGGGTDTLDGGADVDTANFASLATGVVANLTTHIATAPGLSDTLLNIENVTGSSFNDTITGDANANHLAGGLGNDHLFGVGGDDALDGNDGNDILDGGAANDTLSGGNGTDTADFSSDGAGILGSIEGSTATGPAIGSDQLFAIENLIGGLGNDTLTGDGGPNVLIGGAGNDKLIGLLGDDTMDGGAGIDTVDYSRAGGVTVDLVEPFPQDTVGAGRDTLVMSTIENVLGSPFNDTIIGSAADNNLDGAAGSDRIAAGAGNDIITGGAANDVLFGGPGNDTLSDDSGNNTFTGGPGDDVETGGTGNDAFKEDATANGRDQMVGGAGVDAVDYGLRGADVNVSLDDVPNDGAGGEGDNVAGDIENVTTGSGNDAITGSSATNTLTGGDGNDTLSGLDGNDTLVGGNSNDTLVGGNGNDVVQGDAGDDTLQGDAGNDTETGGAGNDVFAEGASSNGGDSFSGGSGSDSADYSQRTAALNVNLADNVSNDGESGEGDNVQTDVERVVGGSGGDTVSNFGGGTAVTLEGRGGNDVLTGGNANDLLLGGEGDDQIQGNGGADQLFGENGNDLLFGIGDGISDLVIGAAGADQFRDDLGLDVDDFNAAAGDTRV